MSLLAINMQVLFSGLALGAIYALVALGFVLIIRATNVVNFAQGDFAMLGAFAMLTLLTTLGLPYWAALVLGLAVMAVFGLLFNYGVYYPLRNRSFLPVIISTLGASIFLQNTVLAAYGPQPQPLERMFKTQGFDVGGRHGRGPHGRGPRGRRSSARPRPYPGPPAPPGCSARSGRTSP